MLFSRVLVSALQLQRSFLLKCPWASHWSSASSKSLTSDCPGDKHFLRRISHYLQSKTHIRLFSAKLILGHVSFGLHNAISNFKIKHIYIVLVGLEALLFKHQKLRETSFPLFACISKPVCTCRAAHLARTACSSVAVNMHTTCASVACLHVRLCIREFLCRLSNMCCHWETHWEDLLNLALTPEMQTPAVLSAALYRTPFNPSQLNNE